MRITIDNGDGRGAVDYTAMVAAKGPVTLQRRLNEPTRCTAEIVLGVGAAASPARKGRVVVSSDAGAVLFTGYLPVEPVPTYAGQGVCGPLYRARVTAISDEWLLDKQGSGASASSDAVALSVSGPGVVAQLLNAIPGAAGASLSIAEGGSARAVGAFAVQPAAGWSSNAGAAANATYAAYRVVNGSVTVTAAGAVTHAFSDGDGTLNLAELQVSHVRELANDVTVSGAEEAAAYVQEVFCGDGTTTEFFLSAPAFRGTNRTLLKDGFGEAVIDTTQWVLADGGTHIALTAAGLTVSGGNGFDGQTTLTALNAVEMSGFLLAQLSGVSFGAASDGMLAGFYQGPTTLANCFCGFRVRQSVSSTGSVTVIVPVVNGVEAGTVFTPLGGHKYTLRLRVFCTEMQRVSQQYYCMVDGTVQGFGGINGVDAPVSLVFELVDEGVASNTPATVLYDTAAGGTDLQQSPATCTFVAVNATNLYSSIASLSLTRPGSLWVKSTLPNGAVQTRLTGTAGQGVDCDVSYGSAAGTPGKVTFFSGRVPQAGERVVVTYRLEQRSVARLADAASVAAEASAGVGVSVPGTSRWFGRVLSPVARSSADCEAAAQALLAMATARAAAVGGSCHVVNPTADIWPGDVLQITSNGVTNSVLVRSVAIQDGHGRPEILCYSVEFANDWATEWADGMGLKVSNAIAADASLPAIAADAPGVYAGNLQTMQLLSVSEEVLQVDAGIAGPSGGGFEVRRRDANFGTTGDLGDLVLRSPVQSFSIPRSAQVERYYVRMYDGSTPPVYSRFSSAVFLNWPFGAGS